MSESPGRWVKRVCLLTLSLVLTFLFVGSVVDPSNGQVVVVLAVAVFGSLALIFEVVPPWLGGDRRGHSVVMDEARPADGVVDFVNVEGIEAETLVSRPEFRRFVRSVPRSTPITRISHRRANDQPLLGRVALISVFVGADGVSWSEEEIAAGHDAMETAASWIEREAIRRDASVNISLANVYFQMDDDAEELVELAFQPEGHDVGPMEANSLVKAVAMASRAASRLGFEDVEDWMQQVNDRIDADSRCWFFHIRRAGRSMALTAADSEMRGVAFALCYGQEASFPEPLIGRPKFDPATLAHELLHLFGASDKYGLSIRSFPEGSVSSRDIMRLDDESLSRLRIDALTAVEIGWSTNLVQSRPKKKPADGSVKSPSSGP